MPDSDPFHGWVVLLALERRVSARKVFNSFRGPKQRVLGYFMYTISLPKLNFDGKYLATCICISVLNVGLGQVEATYNRKAPWVVIYVKAIHVIQRRYISTNSNSNKQ